MLGIEMQSIDRRGTIRLINVWFDEKPVLLFLINADLSDVSLRKKSCSLNFRYFCCIDFVATSVFSRIFR